MYIYYIHTATGTSFPPTGDSSEEFKVQPNLGAPDCCKYYILLVLLVLYSYYYIHLPTLEKP
jgi:hypothetical protein